MGKIRIVTDSTADIPAELRESLGISMVPLKVHIGNETFLDSITISGEQFYEKLASVQTMPTTSQPSPADFLEMFSGLLEREPDASIICICISSALSGTYQSALLAKSMLREDADITVIDSRSASFGIGILATKAAEAVHAGQTRDDIVTMIEQLRQQTVLYFLVDTLEFLQKGGRIGKASALLGALLNIKPILSLDKEGSVIPVDKARGHKKALARVIELLKEQPFASGPVVITIAHSNAMQTAEEVRALLRNEFDVASVTITSLSPVIGTHTGPGAIGIFLLPA